MAVRFPDDDSYEKMILSFKQGNQASLGQLYDKYAPALFGVISRILEDPDKSCDCLQYSFNQIWNQKTSYEFKKERIFTWMIRIARNAALHFLKNGQGSFDPECSTTSTREEGMELKNEPVSTFGNQPGGPVPFLDAELQEVLHLVYIKGFTFAEVATRLNIPVETVKFKFILAIKHLKGKVAV